MVDVNVDFPVDGDVLVPAIAVGETVQGEDD